MCWKERRDRAHERRSGYPTEYQSLLYAEAVLIGIIGGLAGYALGFLSAQAISKGAFNSYIGIPLPIPLAALCMGVIVAIGSSYFPVRGAMKYDPAIILRGE